MATYSPNNVEFARLMKSDEVGRYVRGVAERLADHLRATAPRGTRNKKKNTTRYVDNFHVESGLDVRRKDRSASFVYNDSRYATALEVGSWNIKNPPRPMTRGLDSFHI